jgi:hypothetical protein
MNEQDTVKKRWPREYYATSAECKMMHLRKCSPAKARRQGVLGWRSWQRDKTK